MTENFTTPSKRSETSKNSEKYSFELNQNSNGYSFRNERIFVWLFRTNIRIFGIFVLALVYLHSVPVLYSNIVAYSTLNGEWIPLLSENGNYVVSLLWHIGGYPRSVIDLDFKLWIHTNSTNLIPIPLWKFYPTHCVAIMVWQ